MGWSVLIAIAGWRHTARRMLSARGTQVAFLWRSSSTARALNTWAASCGRPGGASDSGRWSSRMLAGSPWAGRATGHARERERPTMPRTPSPTPESMRRVGGSIAVVACGCLGSGSSDYRPLLSPLLPRNDLAYPGARPTRGPRPRRGCRFMVRVRDDGARVRGLASDAEVTAGTPRHWTRRGGYSTDRGRCQGKHITPQWRKDYAPCNCRSRSDVNDDQFTSGPFHRIRLTGAAGPLRTPCSPPRLPGSRQTCAKTSYGSFRNKRRARSHSQFRRRPRS